MFFRFLHVWALFVAGIIFLIFLAWRKFFLRTVRYKFPYTDFFISLDKEGAAGKKFFGRKRIIFLLRIFAVLMLAVALARPRIVDENSRVPVEGRDIIIALDASGSMELFDDKKDQRSRFSVAKSEALKFVEKRQNDQIGLVIFGATAVSRCPLTLDKKLLHKIIAETRIGDIDPQGTVISIALGMAVKRLTNSKAESKIIILVTDGAPSPHDVHPGAILELAKKYKVKIYTIGVGSEEGGYAMGFFGNPMRQLTPLNKELLTMIATETGGEFFEAKKPEDVVQIYKKIDELETTRYDAPSYTRHVDLFMIFLWTALLFFAAEICVRATGVCV